METTAIHKDLKRLEHQIFSKDLKVSDENFEQVSLEVFEIQSRENEVYRNFLSHLKLNPKQVKRVEDIPFLPVSFFKSHKVILKSFSYQNCFQSSSTSGSGESFHHVFSLPLYEKSFCQGFEMFYGKAKDIAVLCLLPSYLERKGSSLVYMMAHLCRQSQYTESGFFLYNHVQLYDTLLSLEERKIPTLLFGVSFALLDFCQKYPMQLKYTRVMETGGMKGRRKEIIREALHERLKQSLGVKSIGSEYGMTELLSQGYAKESGKFHTPHWMRFLPREVRDPLSFGVFGQTAGLNIIDLANLYSCSFIATDDLGKVYRDGSFEVLGRFDATAVRGCNLLWT